MIIKRFSKTLNTNSPGFIKGRKYDQDFDRLGRLETQRQMAGNELNREMRKLGKELNDGRLGKWQQSTE
jgi:hypothetical protein